MVEGNLRGNAFPREGVRSSQDFSQLQNKSTTNKKTTHLLALQLRTYNNNSKIAQFTIFSSALSA